MKIINVKENSEDAESLTDTTNENESSKDGDENQHNLELDATEYLAGWVAKKYKLQFPELGSTTTTVNSIQITHGHDYSIPSWINRLSYGGLIITSNDFKIKMFRIEKLYRKITKQQIPKGPGVVKNLTKKMLSRMEIAEKYNPLVHTKGTPDEIFE